MLLINNEIFNINIKIVINRSLFKKGIIDNETYVIVNEKLLKQLKEIKAL